MSRLGPPKPRQGNARRRFALVASRFNARYVDGLMSHCTKELRALSPGSIVTVFRVPGAFEIPLVVRQLAAKKKADVIIALGVILQGKTLHAEHLGLAVTNALQRASFEYGLPVIHAVLSLKNEAQARKRCLEDEMNRGTEAARAAVEMASVLAELRK